jgi:hypothetical protein
MHAVDNEAFAEHESLDEGGWPLAIALAVVGPIALVLTVAMIAIAVAG